MIEFTYTLLDFGRRDAGAAAARAQLAAANFSFNRKLQDVVFATQRAFYSIGAAKAAVQAAEENVELAKTDDDAVSRRVDLGLATEPELLLSRETVAQSQYDLASAHLAVREAQASMAVALGVAANTPLDVPSLDSLPVPAGLGSEVDQLIDVAVRNRPDHDRYWQRAPRHGKKSAIRRNSNARGNEVVAEVYRHCGAGGR